MRFSANLNIIIKAIEKASNHISRDFVELENLQSIQLRHLNSLVLPIIALNKFYSKILPNFALNLISFLAMDKKFQFKKIQNIV